MSVRSALATGAGRLAHWGLSSVLHRNASQLPGRLALAIDPQLMGELARKARRASVVVCGTNGKTTTNNVIAAALEGAGNVVLCNRVGANMAPGVVSALLPGREADFAVMEADELSTVHILPQLRPDYLVLLNLFRDQLDRAGEIDRVQDTIVRALLGSSGTTLVVNGDDPLCVSVAMRAAAGGTKVLSFGIGEDLGLRQDRVPEARFCQVCGAELEYLYRSYAQLGAFRCPNGDFARPTLDFVATGVEVGREGVSFDVSGPGVAPGSRVSAGFGGTYMVYNLLAAFAATSLLGVDVADFQRTLDGYHPENGRLQRFEVGGREVVLNLAKNPAGLNQNLSLLEQDEREKALFVLVNDNANDGTDVSWIWDVDFERMVEGGRAPLVFAGGTRANDVQVRMKYAGIDAQVCESVSEVVGRLSGVPTDRPLYVLANYSALFPAKEELERQGGRR